MRMRLLISVISAQVVTSERMFKDLNAFIDALDKDRELARIPEPVSPDLEICAVTDRVSKSPGGGPALLFEKPTGFDMPVAINLYGSMKRMCMALGVPSLDESREGDRGADQPEDARRHARHAEDAADAGAAEGSDAEDGQQRAVPGSREEERHAGRDPDPEVLARGRRALHHAADGVHEGSRDRHAQHRHLPHAGVRRPHHRHALAAPQGRRAALPDRRADGEAARGRGGARRGSGAAVCRHRADAGGARRIAARRVSAPRARRAGQVRDGRSRGPRQRADHPRRLRRAAASAAAKGRSAITPASIRTPTTTRCSTSRA